MTKFLGLDLKKCTLIVPAFLMKDGLKQQQIGTVYRMLRKTLCQGIKISLSLSLFSTSLVPPSHLDAKLGLSLPDTCLCTELCFSSSVRPSSFSIAMRCRYCGLDSISRASWAALASRCRNSSELSFSRGTLQGHRERRDADLTQAKSWPTPSTFHISIHKFISTHRKRKLFLTVDKYSQITKVTFSYIFTTLLTQQSNLGVFVDYRDLSHDGILQKLTPHNSDLKNSS